MRVVAGLLLLSLFIPAGQALAQETVVVFEFKSIGVDEQQVEAATHVFRSELEATGIFSVITPGDVEARLADRGITDFTCDAVACAAEYGAIVGAEKAIIGTLTMLGERVTAEVRLVDVAAANVEFSDRFAVEYIDDLDVALRKLAKAVAGRKKIETELDRFDVTEEETEDARRRKGYVTMGFGFGFGFPLGDSYAKVGTLKRLTWVTRYEARQLVLEGAMGVTWGSGGEKDTVYTFDEYSSTPSFTVVDKMTVAIVPIDIGMRYIFNRGADFTPFVGGGVGMHFIISQEKEGVTISDSDQALALHAAGGLYAFQSYDFRLAVEGRYTIVFSDAFPGSKDSSHQISVGITISRKLEKRERSGCGGGGGCF